MLDKRALKIRKHIVISTGEYKHAYDILFNNFWTNRRLNVRVAISALRFTLHLLFFSRARLAESAFKSQLEGTSFRAVGKWVGNVPSGGAGIL